MSAFDITGAVVWTPLAVMFMRVCGNDKLSEDGKVRAAIYSIILSLASIFCISRLMGAGL